MSVRIALSLFFQRDARHVPLCAPAVVRHATLCVANKSCRFRFMAFPVAAHLQFRARCCHPRQAQHLVSWAVGLLLRFGFISP